MYIEMRDRGVTEDRMETDGKRSARRGSREKRMRRSRVSLRLRAGRRRDKKCLVVRSPASSGENTKTLKARKEMKRKKQKKKG